VKGPAGIGEEGRLKTESAPSAKSPSAGGNRKVAFAALRHKPFRIYLPASFAAQAGDNMEHIISYFAMYQAFHSPLLAGYAVISHWLPVLLFGMYAGAMADRFDCRRLVQISTATNAIAQIGWGYLLVTNQLQPWHAVILLTLHGIAALFHGPAGQLIMHDMVGREDLQSAVRLSATSRQLGVLLGPAIGGALMLAVGPGVALFINSMTQVPLALWLVFAPYTGHLRDAEGPRERRGLSPLAMVTTVRELSNNRSVVAMLAVVALTAVLVGNAFQSQMPEFAEDLGDPDGGHGYTALQMSQAAGALVGGLTLEATGFLRPSVPLGIAAAVIFGLSVAAFAWAPTIEIAVGLLFLTGMMRLALSTTAQTIVQLEAPAAIRGRALGLFATAQQGLQVGAGFTVGVIGAVIGVHMSLGIAGLTLAAACIALFVWAMRRRAVSATTAVQ
jgi:MFS family permease